MAGVLKKNGTWWNGIHALQVSNSVSESITLHGLIASQQGINL